jgi:hypothetical protein
MQNPNHEQKTEVVEEVLTALGELFPPDKAIIVDLQLPSDGKIKTSLEFWTGVKAKIDTRKDTNQRKKWKKRSQGEGKLLLSGGVNALTLLETLVSKIRRPVQLIRLREVIDFRYQEHFKVKIYFLTATWLPRNNEGDDGATTRFDRQLWQRRPAVFNKVLDQVYKLKLFDNPDSAVVRLVPAQQPY